VFLFLARHPFVEPDMFDNNSDSMMYRVLRGRDGRWEVTLRNLKKPLGRFERMEDAMQYARDTMAEERRYEFMAARHA
jgi:hypothetical protein